MNESYRPYAPPVPPDEEPEPDIITYDDLVSEAELDFNKPTGLAYDEFEISSGDLEDDYIE
jgi:hypothetical protein